MELDLVYIGKIVSTHGIKGEVKIISDFPYKEKVFYPGNEVYIGKEKKLEIIKTYRIHKKYDMVTFENYDNINKVYDMINSNVYVDKKKLLLNDNIILDEDLIGFDIVIDKDYYGKIIEIFKASPTNKIIRFGEGSNIYLVPYVKTFIKNIDLLNKKVVLYSIEGVIKCE